MRRSRRALLVIPVVLLLLVAGAYVTARLYLRSAGARRQVVAHLEAAYGGPVQVDDADMSLLGNTTLHGVRLYETGTEAGSAPWASAREAQTDVSVVDLLRGAAPKQLTLSGAAVTLHMGSDGKLLTRLPEAPAGGRAGNVPNIHIDGGEVTLRQDGRPEMVVKGIDADVRPEGDRLTLTGTVKDDTWGEWSLRGTVDPAAGSLTATLDTNRADVTQEKLQSLPIVPKAVWEEVKAAGPAAVEFVFRHDPREKGANHYRVTIDPDGATVTLPTLALDTGKVRGRVVVEDGLVTLDKATGQALGGGLYVHGTLDFRGKDDVFDLFVKATGLAVTKVPDQWDFPEALRAFGGQLNGQAQVKVRIAGGKVTTAGSGGEGKITGLKVAGGTGTIELRLEPGPKGLRIAPRAGAGTRTVRPELLVALVLFQAPASPGPSLTRDLTGAVHGGIRAAGGLILDSGARAVGALPKGDISKPAPPGTPPSYLDINLSLKDVDLAQFVKQLGVKVPFPVGGKLTVKVRASVPVSAPGDFKAYKASGTATLPTFSVAGVDMRDVTAKVRYDNGVLDLTDFRGTLADDPAAKGDKGAGTPAGTFEGTAKLGVVPEGELTANLKLTDIPLAQILKTAGVKEDAGGRLSGSAQLRVPAGKLTDLTAWQGSGKLTAPRVRAYGLTLTDASANVAAARGALTVSDVKGKLEGAAVSGSAEAKLTAPYRYSGKLELARGDLASLQKLAPGVRPPVAVEGQFGVTAEVSGTLSPFAAKLAGSGSGKNVKVDKVAVESLTFRWAIGDDRLRLTGVKAGLYGGEVTGAADVPLSAKVAGKMNVTFKDVDLGELAEAVPGVPLKLEGKAGGTIKGALTAAGADGGRAFDGDVDISSPKLRVQNLPAEKLTGTVSYHKGVGEYHLKGSLLGGTFDLDGRIPPRKGGGAAPAKPAPARRRAAQAEPPPDSRLRIQGAQLGRLGEALGTRGALDRLHGRVDLDVTFRLRPEDYLPVGSGTFRLSRLRWGDTEVADSIRGTVVLADGEARLRDLTGSLAGGAVRGQVVLRLTDLDRSFFNVAIDGADAAQLLALVPGLGKYVEGSVDARLRGRIGRTWHGGGDLVLARGKVYGVEVTDWRLPLTFEYAPARGRARVEVPDMSAQVAHGRVSGRASLGLGEGTHTEGSLRFSGVDLRTLLRQLTDSTQLGAGLAAGRVEFVGHDVRSLDDLTADIDASFSQAQAFQLPVLSALVPFVAPGQSNATFQSGVLRGRLAGGIFRVRRLSLSGSTVSLFADGNVTTGGRLNLGVTATTSAVAGGNAVLRLVGLRLPSSGPLPLSLLTQLASYLSSTSIHLTVGGTVRNPVVRIEPLSVVTEEAARFFLTR